MSEEQIREIEEKLYLKRKQLRKEEEKVRASQIEQRTSTIKQLYDIFIVQYDNEVRKSVYLNWTLLYSAVYSYYDDIYRFKDYSCSKWADNHKQAGYMVKWIIKFKPIQINSNSVRVTTLVLTLNAAFALFVGGVFLERGVLNNISPKFYSHLIYSLTYRNLSGKQLASLFYVLEAAVKGKKP